MILPKFNDLDTDEERTTKKYIIITHVSNCFLNTHPYPPDLARRQSYFCLNEIRNYYREVVETKHLPFHFHVGNYRKDWEVNMCAPFNYSSPLLDAAIESYYIDPFFRDALLVCIQDDLSIFNADPRSYEAIAYYILQPFLSEWKINFRDSVYFFDEIFNWKKYEIDSTYNKLNMRYRYTVNKMKTFDRTIFNLSVLGLL